MTNIKEIEVVSQEEQNQAVKKLRELVIAGKEEGFTLRTDDGFMLRFLYCKNFNPDDAWEQMKSFYKLKASIPIFFGDVPVEQFEHILKNNVKYSLNGRDRKGRSIYISKMGNIDTNVTTLEQLVSVDDLFMEILLDQPETQANGIASIVDVEGYSWRLFRWLKPSALRLCTQKLDVYPIKSLQIHVVNTSPLVNAAVAIVFPFLDAKTKEGIHFHGSNWESLHKHIDPKVLPTEYGGELDSSKYNNETSILHDNISRLNQASECCYTITDVN